MQNGEEPDLEPEKCKIWNILRAEVIKGMDVSGKQASMKHEFIGRRLWQTNPISVSDKVMEFSDKETY